MKNNSYDNRVSRNIGILSESDQLKIKASSVAIAGCGADGGAPAIALARLGVRNFSLADPDIFDASNMNRQEGAFIENIGKNKTSVIADMILGIDPEANVKCFPTGIDDKNINEFADGADVIIEEVDYRSLGVAKLLYDYADKYQVDIISGISVGWRAYGFYFKPGGLSFNEYIDKTQSIKNAKVAPFVPEVPNYISPKLVAEVMSGTVPIPVIDPAVKLSASLLTMMYYALITGNRDLEPMPSYYTAGDLLLMKGDIMQL